MDTTASLMARQHRYNKLLVGFRVLSPAGALLTEIWADPDVGDVSIVNTGFNGMPKVVGRCSMAQFYECVQRIASGSPRA